MKLRILGAFVALILPAFAETDGNYLVRYAAGLPAGDTTVNIVNTGSTTGVTIPVNFNAYSNTSGTGGEFVGSVTASGNICANVYVIDARDEQEVECCSCYLTPDQSVHFSAISDLTANTLTTLVPPSIVIKIVATLPVVVLNPSLSEPVVTLVNPVAETPAGPVFSSSVGTVGINTFPCNPAAIGTVGSVPASQNGIALGQPLVPTGLVAWARNAAGSETGFANAQLSNGELAHLQGLCANIASNGSGAGFCPTLCHYGAF